MDADVSGQGNTVHIAWYDAYYGNEVDYSRTLDGGDTFSDWIGISVLDSISSYNPALGCDGDQFLFVAWQNTTSVKASIPDHLAFTRSFDGGATFEEPATLVYPYASSPDVEVEGANVYLAWADYSASGSSLLSDILLAVSTDQAVHFPWRPTCRPAMPITFLRP